MLKLCPCSSSNFVLAATASSRRWVSTSRLHSYSGLLKQVHLCLTKLAEMVRTQLCKKTALKKGAWSREEDEKLIAYIKRYGIWNWSEMPKPAGLLRSGKSCRLRWVNYLRPDIKRGNFTGEEEETILKMHELLGNKWSAIAAALPGRTDNEIKNHWHTHLKKWSQEPGTQSQLKITNAESKQSITLPELNLLLPNAPETSSSDGSRNIPGSPWPGPAFGIIEDHDIEAFIGSETSGELWGKPLSVEDLYMDNLQAEAFVDPGFILPHSELWFPEATSSSGFYNYASNDLQRA